MTPTPKLRFIERVVPAPEHGEGIGKRVRILQQWCEDHNNILHSTRTNETEWVKHYAGEWRDIPLEQEA
jgi:hypothetical protein